MKPALFAHVLPTLTVFVCEDGSAAVRVYPAEWTKAKNKTIFLTKDEYAGFLAWRSGRVLIQTALPSLTNEQREILMSGMDNAEWHRSIGSDQ